MVESVKVGGVANTWPPGYALCSWENDQVIDELEGQVIYHPNESRLIRRNKMDLARFDGLGIFGCSKHQAFPTERLPGAQRGFSPENRVIWRGMSRLTDIELGFALGATLVGN
jgi:hypothetical protein